MSVPFVRGLGEKRADRGGDEGERVRAGVGGAEALLGVRPCAAHAGEQVGGGGRGAGRGIRGRAPTRRRAARRRRRASVSSVLNGTRASTMRLVADLGLAVGDDPAGRGGDAGGDGCRARRRPRRRSSRRSSARMTPHRAPDVPPARSDQASAARARARCRRRRRAPAALARRARGGAPRCMPMPWSPSPAIWSSRPSSSTWVSIVSAATVDGARRRGAAAARDSSLAGGMARRRRRPTRRCRPLRGRDDRAAAVRGGVDGGVPQPLEFVVQPEERQRSAGHVEARAVLADVRVDDLDAGFAEQLRRCAGRRRTAPRT